MNYPRNVELPALVRSMTFIGSLNQFKAKANLTLFLEKKKKQR